MPIAPTYPGVYIQEIPSGVRTISGVATSITAFVGRTMTGPVQSPTLISSFGDFTRNFGGLWLNNPLSYAVKDFFQNGGSQAVIVRLFDGWTTASTGCASYQLAPPAPATGPVVPNGWAATAPAGATAPTTLVLYSSSPGVWSNTLAVWFDNAGITWDTALAIGMQGSDFNKLFNVTVQYGYPSGPKEVIRNVSVADGPRRLDRVLPLESKYLACAAIATGGTTCSPTAQMFYGYQVTAVSSASVETAVTSVKVAPTAGGLTVSWTAPTPAPASYNVYRSGLKIGNVAPATTTYTDSSPGGAAPSYLPGMQTSVGYALTGGADSKPLATTDYVPSSGIPGKQGIYALESTPGFNLLCIPPDLPGGDTDCTTVYASALAYCAGKRALLLVDPPAEWTTPALAQAGVSGVLSSLGSTNAAYAAIYFPRIVEPDPLSGSQPVTLVPCGVIAGIMAATDTARGVWKAPAGLDASVSGTSGLSVSLTDTDSGNLNPVAVNCLRSFPQAGTVVWGARTMRGSDQLADPYKYIPVRRLALYIEQSLYVGTQWAVFEPNDAPLWAQLRLNIGSFMHDLFRKGAFQGQAATDAYFVKCDSETTAPSDINQGIVNVVVGFAPLQPAEFVIISLQQMAGQLSA